MQLLRSHLVVQFSVVGSLITLVIVIGTFAIFAAGFENIIALLDSHNAAMESRSSGDGHAPIGTQDIHEVILKFRWTAFYVIVGGITGLFISSWLIVLNGWRTITSQHRLMQKANSQLYETHTRVARILDAVGEGIFGIDGLGKVTFVNPKALQMFGLQAVDVLGKSAHSMVHHTTDQGDSLPWCDCFINKTLVDGATRHVDGDILWTSNGQSFPVELTATPIMEGGSVTGAVVAFQDISERLSIEQVTQDSERHFRALFNNALDIFIVLEADGTVHEANAAAENFLGYRHDQIVGRNMFSFLDLSYMTDEFSMQEGLPDLSAWIAEADLQIVGYLHADGSRRMLEMIANTLDPENNRQEILITARDITERSEAETASRRNRTEIADLAAALENRVTRLRMITDLSQLVSSTLNGLEVLQEITRAAARITGSPIASFWTFNRERGTVELRTFSDESIGADFPVRELRLNEGAAGWVAAQREVLNVPNIHEDERFVALDWWETHEFKSFIGIPIVLHGSLLAVLALNGYEPFELDGDDLELLNIFLTQAAISIRNSRLYEELAVENAERKNFDDALTQYASELAKSNTSLNDAVAERMSAVSELKKSESRIRAVVEQMSDGLIIMDAEGQIESFNPAAERIFGLVRSQVIGKGIDTLLTTDGEDEHSVSYPACLLSRSSNRNGDAREFRGLHRDGSVFPIDISASKVAMDDHSLIVSTVRDITDRRHFEDQMRNSLLEKDLLLKELHHRVKNNLQLVSSLMALQSEYIEGESDKALFKDSQHRVRSMALIHEKLYQTDDLAGIDFAVYMQGLVSELSRSYGLNPSWTSVNVDVESIHLGIDTAIPCGLLVNELVSNSFKHAFPNDAKGEVNVSLRHREGKFTLVVQDDGSGIPEHIDWRNTESLGMQLVQTLTDQLRGDITMQSPPGTRFEIVFVDPAKEDKEADT